MQPLARYTNVGVRTGPKSRPAETPSRADPAQRADEPMPQSPPDKPQLQQLLRRAAEGDEQAWYELVDLYAKRVFGLIRSMGASPEMSEEITQATFCKMAEKIESYSELGRFESWLFRIASNRYRDEIRRQNRQARSMEHENLNSMAGASPNGNAEEPQAGQAYERIELLALREAMAELTDNDREVIYLRHSVELSFQRIAEMLDEPIGTILARHHRAKLKLADKLEHLAPRMDE